MLAIVTMAFAGLSLTGWIAGWPVLYSFVPDRPSLSPMTAAMLVAAASGLARLRRPTRWTVRVAITQVGCGVFIALAQATRLSHAGWIPSDWWSSQLTGVVFALSGLATALLVAGRVAFGQVLASLILLLMILLGLGHAFPRADLYRFMPGTGVSIPTVLSFMALSLGQLLAFPESGPSAAMSQRTAVGRAGLRLLVSGGIIAFAVTAFVLASFRRGLFDAETAVLLVAWAAIALLMASLWGVTGAVRRAEVARDAAERERVQLRHMVSAALTHDLRNPLQAAGMAVQVLQRLVQDPRGLEVLQRLQRSHRRVDRLLRALLDSLALDSGQPHSFRPVQLTLEGVVQEVIEENEAPLRGRVDLQGKALGWWDHDALFRVIENLLLNAVKYGDSGTPIRCEVATREPDEATLTVTNRGPAIPGSEWETIFLPFARSDAARQAEPLGWGVGLAFARSAIAAQGGRVRVAASNDDATTFEVLLPVDARRFCESAVEAGRP